jgi:putative transposase
MIKKENSFLKSVHSSPLKNTALRLSHSIRTHQKSKKGQRRGGRVGWPKFRSWNAHWFSLFYDEPNKGFKIEGDKLILSLGAGEENKRHALIFTLKEDDLLTDHQIRNLRLTKEAGKYYAIFTVCIQLPEKKPIDRIIALDPNHKNMAYGVDAKRNSIEIAAPHWLKTYDKRIDELKSKRDSCKKQSKSKTFIDQKSQQIKEYFLPSKRWQNYDQALKRALHKRREQTKTFMYTLAHRLYQRYDCVGIGDYTPHGNGETRPMRRAMNNRSLIGRFKEALKWVAEKSGKTFIEYDEKGTTRTCHCCEVSLNEGLCPSIRNWECPNCQATHIRDENAAINGLRKILRDLTTNGKTGVLSVPGSGLVSIIERWAWRVLPSGMKIILRGTEQREIAAPGNEIESVMALSQG